MTNISKFFNNGKIQVFSHLEKLNDESPLQTIFKNKYKLYAKQINASGYFLGAMGAVLLVGMVGSAYDKEYIANIQNIQPYMEKSMQNYYANYEPPSSVLHEARLEYEQWEKNKIVKGSVVDIINDVEKGLEVEPISQINNEQFKYSLSELKQPAKSNAKFHKKEYLKKNISYNDIVEISKPYGVNPNVIYGMMLKESHGKNTAVSDKSAKGAFQFLKETAKEFSLKNRENSFASADTAVRYMLWIHKIINGNESDFNDIDNLQYSLAGYNAGYSKIKTKTGKKIPNYSETLDYIDDIVGFVDGKKHYVQEGESTLDIAAKYAISTTSLYRANLYSIQSNDDLIWGEFINIEDLDNSEIEITVKKGLNINKIAELSGVSMDEIVQHNNLKNPSKIFIGSVLTIPAISTAGIDNVNNKYKMTAYKP